MTIKPAVITLDDHYRRDCKHFDNCMIKDTAPPGTGCPLGCKDFVIDPDDDNQPLPQTVFYESITIPFRDLSGKWTTEIVDVLPNLSDVDKIKAAYEKLGIHINVHIFHDQDGAKWCIIRYIWNWYAIKVYGNNTASTKSRAAKICGTMYHIRRLGNSNEVVRVLSL